MSDREIIEKIYELYEQKLYYIAFSILNDETLAEDAVQDTFLKLIRNVYKESNRAKKYIIRTIQSTSIDLYRKRKKHMECFEVADVSELAESNSFEDELIERAALEKKLDDLPDKYKEVVVKRFIYEMSLDEIATESGISLAAVRKRYERGMKMLKGEKA